MAIPTPKSRNLNPGTILKNFEVYLFAKVGLGETTIANYISTMRRAFPVLGVRPTPLAVDKYIAAMRKAGKSTSHVVNTSIAFERYGAYMGINIHLARPKSSYRMIQGTLTEAEVARFLGAADKLRERPILALLAYSGGRNLETCNLRCSDIDTVNSTVTFRATKPGKGHTVRLAAPCLTLMIEYLQARQGKAEDPLFVTARHGHKMQPQDIRKLVRVVAKRAGIKKRVYPHLIRHSLGTNLLLRGTGLLAIQDALGHVFLTTTLRYLHSNPAAKAREYVYNAPSYL